MQHLQTRYCTLLLAALLLVGCAPNGEPVPFEIITEQDGVSPALIHYQGEQPDLLVLTEPADIEQVTDVTFAPGLADYLHTLDYNQEFVVVALYGFESIYSHEISITELHRTDDQITIEANFRDLCQNDTIVGWLRQAITNQRCIYRWANSAPYQLLTISKTSDTGSWNREISFVLVGDEQIITTERRVIP